MQSNRLGPKPHLFMAMMALNYLDLRVANAGGHGWTSGQLEESCAKAINNSHVCNLDRILTDAQTQDLSRFIDSTVVVPDSPCVYRIMVVLVERIDRKFVASKGAGIAVPAVAGALREAWRGPGNCCKSTVILVSRSDRQIATNACSETELELCEIQEIFDQNRELFGRGDYYEGLRRLVTEYNKEFNSPKDSCKGLSMSRIVCIALVAFFVGALIEVCILSTAFYMRKRGGGVSGSSYVVFHDAHGPGSEDNVSVNPSSESKKDGEERKSLRPSVSFWM